MSRAYICNKCGLVLEEYKRVDIHPVWIADPFFFPDAEAGEKAQVHLCGKCYAEFEDEYLVNLREAYEQA